MRNKIMFLGIILGLLIATACSAPGTGSDKEGMPGGWVDKEEEIENNEIGRITGTITLTDVPNPAPLVYIHVNGSSNGYWWSSNYSPINISGSGTIEDISWSIPIYQYDDFNASTGQFWLRIETADNKSFNIEIPITPYISNADDDVGWLGTVSIKSITLSGTINVTNNGRAVPRVSIEAYENNTGRSFGSVSLESPGSNAPWSITTAALNSTTTVFFRVYGYSAEWKTVFSREFYPDPEINVYNTDVQGIPINLGNITIITLSGTVNVTNNGRAVPGIRIDAYADDDYSWKWLGDTWLESTGSNTSWSITMEALDSSTPVRFNVSGYSAEGNSLFSKGFTPSPAVYVYNTNVSGVNINLGNVTTVTLSGTINVTYNGQTVYYVSIEAYDNNTGYQLGSTSFNSPGSNESWSIIMPGLDSPTSVRFRVYGYSSNWNYLFEKNITPSSAGNVYNTDVSGININLGNITTVTLSGTVNVTYNWQAVYYVSIEAYDNNTGDSLASDWFYNPGFNEPWSITMEALDSSTPVRFKVYGYSNNWDYFEKYITPSPAVNVYNTNVSGINLNLGEINSSSIPTALTADIWANGEIVYGVDTDWYSINVTSGTTYYIWWDDSYSGSSSKSLDVKVNAIYSNNTLIFDYVDSGWNEPQSFYASQSGTVYIGVKPYYYGYTGTYGIVYSTGSARPYNGPENVTFNSLTANGSATQTTTQLTLSFSQAITGLTADDISISGVYGVQKGTLSGYGSTYTLPISGFTSNGNLSVSVSKSGYTITGSTKTVEIYYYTSTPSTTVAFNSVIANGNLSQTTTQLTLSFSQAITGLTANDITISGVSGVQKGTLSGSGSTYTLPISGFTGSGTITVSVSKSGYTITGSPKTVYIYVYVSSSVEIIINLAEMNEWQLTEQTVQIAPNTNRVFNVTGTYAAYKWYLDGIQVGTASSYMFNRTAGVYQLVVVVTDNNGESRSGRCWIKVVR